MSERPDIVPDGLPDHLPDGERLIWHGRPNWVRLTISAFHVRKVAIYFGIIIAAQAMVRLSGGSSIPEAFENAPVLLAAAIGACGILSLLAYLSAKTTHYALTSKRALMRAGMALPVIINLPYREIDAASFAKTSGGYGNICFKTGGETRLAYLLLWPHAKAWQLKKPQPMFREIPDAEVVASRLASALGVQMVAKEAPSGRIEPGLVAAE
jgi:hypothetical protein